MSKQEEEVHENGTQQNIFDSAVSGVFVMRVILLSVIFLNVTILSVVAPTT